VKYAIIRDNKQSWSIKLACEVLGIQRSGYYAWTKSIGYNKYQEIDSKIMSIFEAHKGRYGSPRITAELNDMGDIINHKLVEKRMSVLNLRAKQAKKYKATTDSQHHLPIAPNLLNQDFSATEINQKWVGDITAIWTSDGWLYLAVIIDLFSRSIIGWSMSNRMKKQLVCDALSMALWRRGFPREVIVHTDRGSQYCSNQYQQLLKDNGLICSMSGKGNCYDNAACESFFHSLKVELIYDQITDRERTKSNVFDYMEIYYNRKRRHSTLGYLTPEIFELQSIAG